MEVELGARHKWKSKFPFDSKIAEIPCTCLGAEQPGAYRMYDVGPTDQAVVWNNCARTLFAAMKRHVAAVPLPEKQAVREYQEYLDNVFLPDFLSQLENFDYSYSEWYNHLNNKQQKDIDSAIDKVGIPTAEVFCKREVQDCTEGIPKNRAIAGPTGYDKHVSGPVCWALEAWATKCIPAYCGGANWEQMEEKITQYYKEGYVYLVQGDGSGFDRTQSHELKHLDRKVYSKIKDKVWHVDQEIFYNRTTSRFRNLKGNIITKNGILKVASTLVDGTVGSGYPDTTLMNTLRMASFIEFMIYKAGLDAKLLVKGDDFVIFVKNAGDYDLLTNQFRLYWSNKGENLNKEFGLGLILKFLTFGDFTTFDFCSTHLICDFKNEKFKIVRQWKRILLQGAYSMKALSYSNIEKTRYVFELNRSLASWSVNMPYYSHYINNMNKKYPINQNIIDATNNLTKSISRKTIEHDGHLHNHNHYIQHTQFGRDFDYGRNLRKSTLSIRDEVVEEFFAEKYSVYVGEKQYLLGDFS